MSDTGYIYVLTNESFHRDNWIKIGYAEDVEKRVKELSNTSVPLPYEVYCTYEIPRIKGVKDPDKILHDIITKLNPSLRISPNREFFEMMPWEAYDMLYAIAQMHGRENNVRLNDSNQEAREIEEKDVEYSVDALFPTGSEQRNLYDKIKTVLLSLDGSLVESPRKNYVTFKKKKSNTISLWPKSNWIEIVFSAKIGQLNDTNGLLIDITNRKWSSEHYALKYYSNTDNDAVSDLIHQTLGLKKETCS